MDSNNKMLRCINCSHDLYEHAEKWLYRCESCGLEQSLLFDSKYNGEDPVGWTESASEFLEELRDSNAKTILKELSEYIELKNKKLLDIGCAAGWFLKAANQEQMETTGLEPEKNIAMKGLEKGLNIKTTTFPDKTLEKIKFDVITFNDVFEHIKDPREMLRQVYEQLTDEGLLVINLPSSNGIIYNLSNLLNKMYYAAPLERLWQKGYFSPHLFYYSNRNLAEIVEKQGFELVSHCPLNVIKIKGLWNRLNHSGSINIFIIALMYLSLVLAYPLLKYVFPSDIMLHIYRKG